jgi:hypothetical protein
LEIVAHTAFQASVSTAARKSSLSVSESSAFVMSDGKVFSARAGSHLARSR